MSNLIYTFKMIQMFMSPMSEMNFLKSTFYSTLHICKIPELKLLVAFASSIGILTLYGIQFSIKPSYLDAIAKIDFNGVFECNTNIFYY